MTGATQVLARYSQDLGSLFSSEVFEGRVLGRSPGTLIVEVLPQRNVSLPAGALRSVSGRTCAFRAALCLFGRVGNLQGKFDAAGSTAASLEAAAPTVQRHVLGANAAFSWEVSSRIRGMKALWEPSTKRSGLSGGLSGNHNQMWTT